MPEPIKPNLEAKISPVTDDYAETIANRKPGFTIIENGEEVTAISKKEFRKLSDSKKSETRERQSAQREDNADAEGIDDALTLRRSDMKRSDIDEEPEPEPQKVEAEPEDEFVDEDVFLKQQGIYNDKFMKTLADVDKEIEYRRKKVMDLDGYDGNEELFTGDSVATPEDKISTLKKLRSAVGRISEQNRIERRAEELARSRGVPEKTSAEPKKSVDLLSDEDKLLLDDPTPDNIGKVLDKLVALRVNEKISDIDRKVGKIEFEHLKKEKGIDAATDLMLRNLLKEKPYLQKAIQNLSIEDSLELLQTINNASKSAAEIEQARTSGVNEQRDREAKRKAQIRLRPGKATRINAEAEVDKDLLAKISEARQARKDGKRVSVANIIADRLRRAPRTTED